MNTYDNMHRGQENFRTAKLPYLEHGVVLRGRYIIDAVIGSGGFGVTYKAWDTILNCLVAIKEYFPKSFVNRTPGDVSVSIFTDVNTMEVERGIKRFLQEAQDLARFNNRSGIVSVYDFFEENNTAYMVMEFLEGCTLKEYLKSNGERLNIDTGLYIINSLLSTLAEVHKLGIIHRDISPDNIFICSDSSIKLLDFGAAKQTLDIYNQTVSIVLKHGFAPPEQYLSKGEFGPWTDIYALGATMYKMFTGILPTESVERMVEDKMPEPNVVNPDIPQYLNDIIMKAMSVKVEDRYHSVEELMDALNHRASGSTDVVKKIIKLCAPIVGVAVVAIIVLLGVQSYRTSADKKQRKKIEITKTEEKNTEEAGKSKSTELKENNSVDTEKTEESKKTEKTGPEGLTLPKTDSEPIYIYSWDDDLGNKLQYVKNKYPEYADLIRYVNLDVSGTSGDYQEKLETALAGNSEVPSIIASDVDITWYFTDSDISIPLAQIGLTRDMYSNAFQYTVDYGSVNGQLKAVSWQATPGCFVYRTDIAEAVLGSSDPVVVQESVKDWDTFLDTAKKMKAAGYKMVSGADDIQRAVLYGNKSVKSLVGDTITLEPSISDYLDLAHTLYKNGYTNGTDAWDSAWFEGMTGDVFGYFGCPWFVYGTLRDEKGSATYGKRNICQGPDSYYWGGTYLTVMSRCPNKELAALVLYTLCCDTDVMYQMLSDNVDFVNNEAAIDRAIANGQGATDILNGYNPFSVWKRNAEKINCSYACDFDITLNYYITNASWDYNHDVTLSTGEALDEIKQMIQSDYPGFSIK